MNGSARSQSAEAQTVDAWYLYLDGQTLGPLAWSELSARVLSAGAHGTAQVCRAGETAWQRFPSPPQQRSRSRPSPTPLPVSAEEGATLPPVALGQLPIDPQELLEQRAGAGASFGRVWRELRSLPFPVLFPVRDWLADRPWNLLWVRWFAFFAFFPMLLYAVYREQVTLQQAAWSFGLYFAMIWGLLLHLCLRPGRVSTRRVVGVAAFTALVGVNVLLACQRLPVISDFYTATDSASLLGRLTGYILGVGILEETTKALPLLWLFLHRRAAGGLREALYLGACSGLGFGVAEAVSYSFAYASWHANLMLGDGGWVLAQLLRFITLPLLHALWAGVVGYFVGLAAMLPHRAWGLVAVGIGVVAIVHGLYDTLGPWSSFALALFSFLVFVGYTRTAGSVAERLGPRATAAP